MNDGRGDGKIEGEADGMERTRECLEEIRSAVGLTSLPSSAAVLTVLTMLTVERILRGHLAYCHHTRAAHMHL